MTVNPPLRFSLAKRFLKVGSIDWETPVMLEIVAVGAIAMVLLLRIPCFWTAVRMTLQSRLEERSMLTGIPLSCSRRSIVSIGSNPRSHFDPL